MQMDTAELIRITQDTTTVYRKGEVVEQRQEGHLEVTEIFNYPPAHEAPAATVDMVFVTVGVDLAKAEPQKEALLAALGDGIGPETGKPWANGPSYIHIGADLGDQELALRFMALCAVLHIGGIMSPMHVGMEGEQAKSFAGSGFLYLTNLMIPEAA